MKVILATQNKNKVIEIKEIFKNFDIEIISLIDLNYNKEIIEDGKTFEENALIKAREIYNLYHLPVISDDSGLEVEALGNAPGIYSARYAKTRNDLDNINLLLNNMRNITNRNANFNCTVCYYEDNSNYKFFVGKCYGKIGYQLIGNNGFGYDPVFMIDNTSFASLSLEEKNKISHRSIAFNKLKMYLFKK